MPSECQICSSPLSTRPALSLGAIPSVNDLRGLDTKLSDVRAFPLNFYVCGTCSLGQIDLVVEPSIIFPPTYPYVSGSTRILRENFTDLATKCGSLMGSDGQTRRALDIGSNDGTLLASLRSAGFEVLGIEPTDAADLATSAGLPTHKDFFTWKSARVIREVHGPFDLITAANVFAHMPDPHSLVDSVNLLLSEGGIFVSESHYLVDLMLGNQYDTIYHEHLRYYSVSSLEVLFRAHGFEIFDVERIPTHGGSIRVFASRPGERARSGRMTEILDREALLGLASEDFQWRFWANVVKSKSDLLTMLSELRSQHQHMRLVGIGAPSRAATLINYVGLYEDQVLAVAEVATSPKIGLCMPGTAIPVLSDAQVLAMHPTHALILSWHIAGELIEMWRHLGFQGDFIIPLPTPHLVS